MTLDEPESEVTRALRLLHRRPSLRRLGHQAIRAELARRHFTEFAPWVWPRLELSPFHVSYLRVLESFARGEIRRLMVSVPPQHGKSLATTILLPTWLLGDDPSRRIAIASYNASLATRFNRQVQRLLGCARYAACFPASALRKGRKGDAGYSRSAAQIDIPGHSGGTFAVGREGTLTGNSVDVFILDDLYKDAMEANSPIVRENCWEWYTSVVRTRLHNRSQELIVFTRWHEDDLMGRIAAREKITPLTEWSQLDTPCEGWLHLNFEAIKQSPPSSIDPREEGEPLWPARHGIERLTAARSLDPARFAALYQGNPASGEGILYGERFQTYDVLPADVVRRASYTDTADTGDDYLCTVCYCVGRDGLVYVTDVVYSRQPMEITEPLVAQVIARNDTRLAWVESNNGGRGFARALGRALPGVDVRWFHQSANKEARILSNAPTLLQTVRMPRGWMVRWPEWYAHLTAYRLPMTANRWHDAPDALTGVIEKESAARSTLHAVRFSK